MSITTTLITKKQKSGAKGPYAFLVLDGQEKDVTAFAKVYQSAMNIPDGTLVEIELVPSKNPNYGPSAGWIRPVNTTTGTTQAQPSQPTQTVTTVAAHDVYTRREEATDKEFGTTVSYIKDLVVAGKTVKQSVEIMREAREAVRGLLLVESEKASQAKAENAATVAPTGMTSKQSSRLGSLMSTLGIEQSPSWADYLKKRFKRQAPTTTQADELISDLDAVVNGTRVLSFTTDGFPVFQLPEEVLGAKK